MAKRTPRRRRKKIPAGVVAAVGLASLLLLVEAGFQAAGTSLLALFGGGRDEQRMARFADAPRGLRTELLYLSYLDSLARHERALPAIRPGDDTLALPALVAARAGVPASTVQRWGFVPPPEPDQGPLNRLFREMHRRGRAELPLDNASFWDHVRDRKLHPGYVVFGQTRFGGGDRVDFCGVMTVVNWLQPEHSALLYRDPGSGELVHGSVTEMPTIAYFGAGRPGEHLAAVYHEYFRLSDQRGRKPLYQRDR